MTRLLQQTEFPLRTVNNIEQLKVILKSRVWDAEEEAGRGSKETVISQTTVQSCQ
jgi:hypothetical protein